MLPIYSRMAKKHDDDDTIRCNRQLTGPAKRFLRLQERISVPPPIPGLPEGISQRDDVYTKTEAFLTHVPNLD